MRVIVTLDFFLLLGSKSSIVILHVIFKCHNGSRSRKRVAVEKEYDVQH